MAPQTVTVRYSKPGTQPPIYLAGSFSAWQPEEMQYTTDANNEHEFYKEVEVEPGKEYQYKFRLGHVGDWWILNEDSPTVTDDIGNKNNLLSIPKLEESTTATEAPKSTPEEPKSEQAESRPMASMEKEKTPSIEETMGTRETDDALFADDIIKDTVEGKQELNSAPIGGIVEPHPTPAVLEKLETESIEEAEHTKELQEINGAEPSSSKLDDGIIEPTPAPYVDIKRIQDIEDIDSKNAFDDQMEEDKAVAPPALAVEEAKPESKGEEKSSVEPAAIGHNADHLQTADTIQDIRNGARTPELADVAAEVADVAATLDRDQPTPPISDEEAGRIGFRRMSLTPIPQVAITAAEVADSAAVIDKEEEEEPEKFIRPFDIDDGPLPDTPPNEKVPLFSHECCSPPDHQEPRQPEDFDPYEGMRPRVEVEEPIDLNDPNIKMFPTDRAGIMEHLRLMQERLPEDEVKLDLAPRSPIIDPNNSRAERRESRDLPVVSPVVLAQRSPSLDSIAEGNDESSNVLASAPVKLNGEDKPATNGINVTKHETPTATADDGLIAKENEAPLLEPERKARHLAGSFDGSDESGLNAKFEQSEAENAEIDAPVTDHSTEESNDKARKGDVSEVHDAEPTKSTEDSMNSPATVIPENDTAKSTAVENETDDTQVKSRKRQASPARGSERPGTPTSMRSPSKDVQDAKERSMFKAFFRVVFVEWIGGFFLRLCGGRRRRQVLTAGVVTMVAAVPALYYFDLIPQVWESSLQHLHIPLR